MDLLPIVLQSILYGFGDPVSKVAYESMPVFSLLSARYLIAAVALSAVAGRRTSHLLRTCRVRDWLVPSLGIAGCYVVSNIALAIASATSTAFIRSLTVVFVPILAFLVYRVPYDRRHLPVLAGLVAGMYLLCGRGGLSGFGLGEVLALASNVMMAVALVVSARSLAGDVDGVALTCLQAWVSFALAAVCSLAFDGGPRLESGTPRVWAIIVYLALGCTLAGYLLQNLALRRASASSVAVVQCLYPVMTAVFSFVILGEQLSAAGVVGAAVIVACVVADALVDRRRPA